MYISLGIKSDYSLLKSLIKISDLITFLKDNNITTCGILDDNLFSSMCFYNSCVSNGIKPIIGLDVPLSNGRIYLYAKNYSGYQNLLKINSLTQKDEVNFVNLKKYVSDVICVVPFGSINFFDEVINIFNDVYISYQNEFEKNNALLKSKNVVFINEVRALQFQDVKYLSILSEIDNGQKIDLSLVITVIIVSL